jgi:hypothetical protein
MMMQKILGKFSPAQLANKRVDGMKRMIRMRFTALQVMQNLAR